ncbi:MAG: hypothetical protein WA364_28885, partial [Candidatus Nitrosopolaris sp.]
GFPLVYNFIYLVIPETVAGGDESKHTTQDVCDGMSPHTISTIQYSLSLTFFNVYIVEFITAAVWIDYRYCDNRLSIKSNKQRVRYMKAIIEPLSTVS